ncbi:MAG: hypothetical protein ACLFTZ_01400 [Acholeplasmataceae bacterium]
MNKATIKKRETHETKDFPVSEYDTNAATYTGSIAGTKRILSERLENDQVERFDHYSCPVSRKSDAAVNGLSAAIDPFRAEGPDRPIRGIDRERDPLSRMMRYASKAVGDAVATSGRLHAKRRQGALGHDRPLALFQGSGRTTHSVFFSAMGVAKE